MALITAEYTANFQDALTASSPLLVRIFAGHDQRTDSMFSSAAAHDLSSLGV